MTQTEFWKNAKPGFTLPMLNDPRMTYDPIAERWYTVVQAQDATPYGFLAVSESMDPTQGWKGVQLPMKPANLGMKLGFDKNGIYITFIVMTGNTHTMHGCFAIPKADAIAADGPRLANVQSFTNLEIESFPATDINPNKPADAPELILNREFGNSFSKMYLYKLTWSGKTATLSKAQIIPLSRTYQSPNGASLRAGRFNPLREANCGPTRPAARHASTHMAAASSPVMPPRKPSTPGAECSGARSGRATARCCRKVLWTPRTATTWCPRSPSMQTAISAWAAHGPRKQSSRRSAS